MTSRIIAVCSSAPRMPSAMIGGEDRDRIGHAGLGHRIPGDEGAEHIELAMREIHQPRDAEQDGPAQRDAGIAGAEHEAVDDLLRDIHGAASAIVPR